jgi:isoamylase
MSGIEVQPCFPRNLGCTLHEDGVCFSVFSRNATQLHLLLFDEPRDGIPRHDITLDAEGFRTGDIWSAHVTGLREGQLYALAAEGPFDPSRGLYFDHDLLLIDPYARAVTDGSPWTQPDLLPGSFVPGSLTRAQRETQWSAMPKCVVTDDRFDWEGDRPLGKPLSETVIYETHVRGFTAHPSSGAQHAGTYQGLVEKIPYLRDLGVTAVELLPVQEFDEAENPRSNPLTGRRLTNYWGYSPFAFFAPECRYSHLGTRGGQVASFKGMVKALHAAGIEVILDVVFNHTAEGDQRGPTFTLAGLDNPIYYTLADDGERYLNLSGCGNTVNCNHPVVRTLIRDCLRTWVMEMHVDGFRFDLASILGRDSRGHLMENPPLIELITEDPVLRDTKLIAEAWDAAGAYQVGSFPGLRWSEWNGRYRDDVRRFWRGDRGMIGALATRLAGSSDLYRASGRSPLHSINFVTAHDGFTLADLVSHARRHNEANGEENRDGSDHENSWNHGHEGPSDDPDIRAVRERQVRNLLLTLLVSQGVPMLLGGDEVGRTQGGNNNAYCHDDETSWFDWQLIHDHADLHGFVRALIALRREHPVLRRATFLDGQPPQRPDVSWFGPDGSPPRWEEPDARELGCILCPPDPDDTVVALLFNASEGAVDFVFPAVAGVDRWEIAVVTGAPRRTEPRELSLVGRSAAVLLGRRGISERS